MNEKSLFRTGRTMTKLIFLAGLFVGNVGNKTVYLGKGSF